MFLLGLCNAHIIRYSSPRSKRNRKIQGMSRPNDLVLITGGAGFIGSHTADRLAAEGFRIRIVDNLQPPVHAPGEWPSYVQDKGYELVNADVRDKGTWEKALEGVSYVYHLAAYQHQVPDFSTFFTTNTVSTALLYEVTIGGKLPVKKIVMASSQFIYGDGRYESRSGDSWYPGLRSLEDLQARRWNILGPDGEPARFRPFVEDQEPRPTNAYGLSKTALEQIGMLFGMTYGIPTVAMRYSIVQGPRQSPKNIYSGALRIFVSQALTGQPITVFEDGLQLRDFVNVGDVTDANYAVLKDVRADYQVFNVGSGEGYQIGWFAELVKRLSGSRSEIVYGGFRQTDTRNAISTIDKIKRLGWAPRHTPEKSVGDYLSWIRTDGLEGTLTKGIADLLRSAEVVEF